MPLGRLTTILLWLLEVFLLASGYWILAQFSFSLAVYPGQIAPIWLPSGLALAWSLIRGTRPLLGVFLGSLAINAPHAGIGIAAVIANGPLLQTLLAVHLIKRFALSGKRCLPQSAQEMASYLAIATLVPVIASTLGSASLYLGGYLVWPLVGPGLVTWWIGDASGHLLLAPLILVIADRRFRWDRWEIYGFLLSTLAMGLGAVVELSMVRQHRGMVAHVYHDQADHILGDVKNAADSIELAITSVASFLSASEPISPRGFRRFCRPLQEQKPWIQALSWIPTVLETQSESDPMDWEEVAVGDGYPDFPIYRKVDGLALQKAWNAGKPTATSPLYAVQQQADQPGIHFFVPVYQQIDEEASQESSSPVAAPNSLQGFAAGVILVEKMLLEVLDEHSRQGLDILIRDVTDANAPAEEQRLAWSPGSNQFTMERSLVPPPTLIGEWVWQRPLSLGGRDWLLQIQPTAEQRAIMAAALPDNRGIPSLVALMLAVLVLFYIRLHQRGETALVAEKQSLTEKVRARTIELEDQRQWLITLVRTIPDLVWAKDLRGVYLACNPAFERFFGASESAIKGRTDYDFVDTSLADFFRAKDREAIEAGGPRVNQEWITFADDGRLALVETIKAPMVDGTGKVIGVLGIARDITATNQVNRALHRSETHYRTLFRESPLGYALNRLGNRTFLQVNTALAKLVNHPLHELLTLTDEALTPEIFRAEDERQWQILQETGHCGPYEKEYFCRGGPQVPVRVSRVLVTTEDEVPLVFSVLEDITSLREMNQALHQAKEAAELASRMKSAFLANMSHEIRTPLTAILGFTETLFDLGGTREQQQAALQAVLDNGRHLHALINDLLDMSKIEAGRLEFETLPLDLASLLEGCLSSLQTLAQQRGLELSAHYLPPLPPHIHSDPTRLRQILLNLLSNALKFTQRGAVRMLVSCDISAQELVVSVLDSGIGIDDQQRERLFQAFVQADSSITRRYGGTGLGLSLARQLTQGLGGDLQVESSLGAGSLFVVRIPTGPLNPADLVSDLSGWNSATAITPVAVAALAPPPCCLCGRVLLAEDNPYNQQLLGQRLTRLGITVVIASNGEEAVSRVMAEPFDLVLMDVQMPVMDGLEATQLLREALCPVPIVALTAHSLKSHSDQAKTAGCNDFLTKPVDWTAFYRVLTTYLPVKSECGCAETHSVAVPSTALPAEEELVAVLGERFRHSLPSTLTELEQALQEGKFDRVAHLAHQIKGVAGGVGYIALGAVAATLETAAQEGNVVATVTTLAELRRISLMTLQQ